MRIRTSAMAAGCVVAAALAMSGCASTNAGNAGDSSSTTPTAGASATASQSAQAQAAGSGDCQAANLAFALGASDTNASPATQVVDLTNKGSSTCTMDGFPGVDLVGVADGQTSYTWSLQRQSVSYSAVTVQPGGTAHFVLYFLPEPAGSGEIAVTKFVITPPNTYTQAEVSWDMNIELQDGATHPGTYIGPIVSGS